jgi:hypothetical protein
LYWLISFVGEEGAHGGVLPRDIVGEYIELSQLRHDSVLDGILIGGWWELDSRSEAVRENDWGTLM